MEVLGECGYRAVPLSAVADWLEGGPRPPERSVVLTFDDGFADFESEAVPILLERGWTPTVFLPSGRIGAHEDWRGAHRDPARRLLDWDQVRALAARGIEFGGHTVTHPDLTELPLDELADEIRGARDRIEAELGVAPTSFAPPYGHSNARVIAEVRRWYRVSVGTRLDRVARGDDPCDLPRIEMHYFRDLGRWRRHLEGRGEVYLRTRRALRAVKARALSLRR